MLELLKSVDESTNAVIIALITREFQVTFSSCVEYELIFSSKECSCDSFTQKLRRSTYWLANLVFRASTWNVGPLTILEVYKFTGGDVNIRMSWLLQPKWSTKHVSPDVLFARYVLYTKMVAG